MKPPRTGTIVSAQSRVSLKRLCRWGLVGLGSTVSSMAQAQAPPPPTIQPELALSSGLLWPAGSVEQGRPLGHEVDAVAPFTLEIGARVVGHISLAITASYGPGWMGDDPPTNEICWMSREYAGEECGVSIHSLGLAAAYHPVIGVLVDPWVGVGFGHEWLGYSGRLPVLTSTDPREAERRADASFVLEGWRLPSVRLGAEVALYGPLSLGAFGAFALGKFAEIDSTCDPQVPCADLHIQDRAFHEWIGVGVRAVVLIPVGHDGSATRPTPLP